MSLPSKVGVTFKISEQDKIYDNLIISEIILKNARNNNYKRWHEFKFYVASKLNDIIKDKGSFYEENGSIMFKFINGINGYLNILIDNDFCRIVPKIIIEINHSSEKDKTRLPRKTVFNLNDLFTYFEDYVKNI